MQQIGGYDIHPACALLPAVPAAVPSCRSTSGASPWSSDALTNPSARSGSKKSSSWCSRSTARSRFTIGKGAARLTEGGLCPFASFSNRACQPHPLRRSFTAGEESKLEPSRRDAGA